MILHQEMVLLSVGVSLEPLARKKMERVNWGKDRLGPVPVCCWVHWLLVFASGHLCLNF